MQVVVDGIYTLLKEPNSIDVCCMMDIAIVFRDNRALFEANARECTEKYAK